MDRLDPLIHQRTRLTLFATLHRNRQASFTDLRDGLNLTGGNLKSHADKLIEAGYLESFRALVGREFELRYRITEEGSEAFQRYLEELRSTVEATELASPKPADAEGRKENGPDPRL